MHCKSIWMKASAKCISVNVNTAEVEIETHFEKMALKHIDCNWNLQMQTEHE